MIIKCPYFIKTKKVKSHPGCWDINEVSIYQKFDNGEEKKIGEYKRMYSNMFNTFHPFMQDGKWFALYSDDYTRTGVLELPSCKEIAGEKGHSKGFCPVDYYVPYDHEELTECGPHFCGKFGFIAGCVWGDDSSWKIQYLDLSQIQQGKLKRDDRFGYIEMPDSVDNLIDCISFDLYYSKEANEKVKKACEKGEDLGDVMDRIKFDRIIFNIATGNWYNQDGKKLGE